MPAMHQLLEITFLRPLHHQAQFVPLHKGFLVGDDVGMVDFAEHPHLIKTVIFITPQHMT